MNVIAVDYVYGLRWSRALVAAALADQGFRVRVISAGGRWQRLTRMFQRRTAPSDVNLFLEHQVPEFYRLGQRNVLIPNQEWFFPSDAERLPQADLIICKTRHAEEIFSRLGAATAYASFTSRDLRRPNASRRREFLCLGARQATVVARIAALWERHPEWPRLTLVTERTAPEVRVPNIRHFRRRLPDDAVVALQNEHWFHLCLSRAEGFGHKLNEGMSCGAIVIATDGAPMNELIRPERGLLVRSNRSEPMRQGIAFEFDEDDLEATIERCLGMEFAEMERRGALARQWFEENDRSFRERLPQLLRLLVASE